MVIEPSSSPLDGAEDVREQSWARLFLRGPGPAAPCPHSLSCAGCCPGFLHKHLSSWPVPFLLEVEVEMEKPLCGQLCSPVVGRQTSVSLSPAGLDTAPSPPPPILAFLPVAHLPWKPVCHHRHQPAIPITLYP